jgi:hypothetical protein
MGNRIFIFDFDVNLLHLDTKINLLIDNEYKQITGEQWATLKYQTDRYSLLPTSFDNFNDGPFNNWGLDFIDEALLSFNLHKFGPSWHTFIQAIEDKQHIAIITARGHEVGIFHDLFQKICDLLNITYSEKLVHIYPVNNPLFINKDKNVHELKEKYFKEYLEKFDTDKEYQIGFSDDDLGNIKHFYGVADELSKKYKKWKFYIFDTSNNQITRTKIYFQ